jgi:hypothetical protein
MPSTEIFRWITPEKPDLPAQKNEGAFYSSLIFL